MKLTDAPLWVQMCSPNLPQDELAELRFSLSKNPHIREELERFLHAQWCYLHNKVRRELDVDMRNEYQHSANAIAEITGMLFSPEKPIKTTGKQSLV